MHYQLHFCHKEMRTKLSAAISWECQMASETATLPTAAAADAIRRNGYAIVPLDWLQSFAQREDARALLSSDIVASPEFAPHAFPRGLDSVTKANPLVGGGFSALGNPSSFHGNFPRQQRRLVHPVLRGIMAALLGMPEVQEKLPFAADTYNFAQLYDRVMVRPKGSAATRESWHRDFSPRAAKGSMVFGGWINYDETPQHFSCVPGSHCLATEADPHISAVSAALGGGGASVGFKLVKNLDGRLAEETLARVKDLAQLIEIPAGHLLLFSDEVLHEVLSKPARHQMVRLFIGCEVTPAVTPMFRDTLADMDAFAPMRIKSDQPSPLYPKFWMVFPKNKALLEAFAGKMSEDFLLREESGAVKLAVVCPSLVSRGLSGAWAKYSEEEKAMVVPSRVFA